jgi:hypothetical protein
MCLEVDFGAEQTVDEARVLFSEYQGESQMNIAVKNLQGGWRTISGPVIPSVVAAPADIRKRVADYFKQCGIRWVLFKDQDFPAEDVRLHSSKWGFVSKASVGDSRLYQIE